MGAIQMGLIKIELKNNLLNPGTIQFLFANKISSNCRINYF